MRLAPERTRARAAWVPGSRPGMVTSAPCSTTALGHSRRGPISPSGRAGSRITARAPVAAACCRIRRASSGDGRSGSGSRVRWMVKACSASKRAASGCGVVTTVTSSGGRRRHSSQRYTHGHRAARRRRFAAAAQPTRGRHRRTGRVLACAVCVPLCAARRGVRRARAPVAADRPRVAAPHRAPHGGPRRAARDLLPAPPGGPPGAVPVASGRALGPRRAEPGSA